MKKLYLTMAVVAAAVLGMTSCSNKEKCWEIKSTTTTGGISVESTIYYWGTKDQRDTYIDDLKSTNEKLGITYKINSKKHVKASDQKDCLSKNGDKG